MNNLKKQDIDLLNTWIIKKLDELNWSMRKLGKKAGIHNSLISRVLSGKREKDLGFYFLVACAVDSIPEMLQIAGLMSDNEVLLLYTVKSLPAEKQEEFFEFASFFAKKYKPEPE